MFEVLRADAQGRVGVRGRLARQRSVPADVLVLGFQPLGNEVLIQPAGVKPSSEGMSILIEVPGASDQPFRHTFGLRHVILVAVGGGKYGGGEFV